MTEGFFEFKALGATQVKGATEPVRIYEVLGVGPLRNRLQMAAGRGLLKFVGRKNQMEQLLGALSKAKGGHGQIVAAMGEAGVGKSRAELKTARALAEELMSLVRNLQDSELLLQAHRVLGAALFYHGELGASQAQL